MHLVPSAHLSGIFSPLKLLPMLIAAVLYARRATTLAARGRPVPLWRQICFGAGLLCIALALITPLSDLADELVIAHMIEHLLIGDIASLLIVLGLTGPLLQPILAIKFFDRLRVLCHPVVAMAIWTITLFFWHAPPLYDAAYGTSAIHFLEHSMFIMVGILLWMPVFGPLPMPTWFTAGWKVVYVILMRLIATVLGNILMWDGQVLYSTYAVGEARHNIEPLTDQSLAGVVMMVDLFPLGVGEIGSPGPLAFEGGQAGLLDLGAQGRHDGGGVPGPGRHPVPLHLVGHDLAGPGHLVLAAGEGVFHGGPEDVHVEQHQAVRSAAEGSTFRGIPRSTTSRGSSAGRTATAASSMERSMIGSVVPTEVNTTSDAASSAPRPSSVSARPGRPARRAVRHHGLDALGRPVGDRPREAAPWPSRAWATPSPISPAPTTSTRAPSSPPGRRPVARATAPWDSEVMPRAMAVSERTRLPVSTACRNRAPSTGPDTCSSWALSQARRTWPRTSDSPSTAESRPAATVNRCW